MGIPFLSVNGCAFFAVPSLRGCEKIGVLWKTWSARKMG